MKKTQIAYLAGLFDGEGYVGIVKKHPKARHNPSHVLQVEISNTHKPTIDFVNRRFSGCVYKFKPTMRTRKICWDWRGTNRNAIKFLETVLPYLRIKRSQAILGLRFQKEKNSAHRNGGLSIKTLQYRDKIMKRMQTLKKYGAHSGDGQ
jgi:hypothetical protein